MDWSGLYMHPFKSLFIVLACHLDKNQMLDEIFKFEENRWTENAIITNRFILKFSRKPSYKFI